MSGYSGAGTSPSPRNDPHALKDNLMPYALVDHVHEREVTRQLRVAVEFMPHVAPHFRGLAVTTNMHVDGPVSGDDLTALYRAFYAAAPLVHIDDDAPWVRDVAGTHEARIGGITASADGRRVVVVCVLELAMGNLLWARRPAGRTLSLALLPFELFFWFGFALPFGFVVGAARAAITVVPVPVPPALGRKG